ncbi:MAG TPA: PEGA domain-containing protein [Vicinamibacterales bacterium]|nr:PEGA domain-containing protein [Vicinamibacterales bacterium]
MESYPFANLITGEGAGASTANGSCEGHSPYADGTDDIERDLLLDFTSECEFTGEVESEPDASLIEDAFVPVAESTLASPSVTAIVAAAAATTDVTPRSRLTTDWQMQAARTAVVVPRRTWTIRRRWQAAFSSSRLALRFSSSRLAMAFSDSRLVAALSGSRLAMAFSRSRFALPTLPFVYGVIFGGVTVLLATGQLHERPVASHVSPAGLSPARPAHASVEAPVPLVGALTTPIPPVRQERATSGTRPSPERVERVVFRGSLGLDSRPQGARVYVNGLDVGRTPVDLKNLAVGSRAVRLELPGYQTWSSVIRVVTDQRSHVTADLLPSPPQLSLAVNADDTSSVAFEEGDIP